MISASNIKEYVEGKLTETPLFVVDVQVSSGNHIEIDIDSPSGVNVSDCLTVNRIVEEGFDRDVEDYSLEVASPGLDKSLKIIPQYLKNVGRRVKVVTTDGAEIEGLLSSATENGFEVTTEEKIRPEGKKKKELVTTVHQLEYDKVKTTHIIISFK
ncbi:MAG: ribosome assembly cofactor RimP [Bacteroidota bacterium]